MKRRFTILTAALALLVSLAIPMGMWGQTASFAPSDFSGQGTSGTGSEISATVDGVTFACDKGYGTTQIRCYSGGVITISSSNTITAISFTFSGSYTGGMETSYTNLSTTSWTKTLSSQARITACSISYTGGDTPQPTTYTVTFDAGEGTFVASNDLPYESNTVVAGTYILPSATRDGYTFNGWALGESTYEGGATYTVNADADFVATYTENSGNDDEITATLNIQDYAQANNWTNGTKYTTATVAPVTFTANGGGNTGKYYESGHDWRFYQGESASITISVAEGYTLVSVTPTYSVSNGGVLKNGNTTIASGTTVNVSGTSATFTVGNSGSATNGQVRFTNIDVVYVSDGSTQTASDLTIINESTDLTFDLYNNTTAQVISYTTSSTGAITITPAESDYFSYVHDAAAKTITVTPTAVTPSAQTVTISQAADDDYYAGTATFTVSVANSDPNIPGTENNPYTVAQARAAIDANSGTQGVYATGIVSAIPTAYNSTYGNVTFNMVDEEGDEVFLQAYRCGGDEAANVAVGDVAVVYGNLTKYGSTYEFGSGCQLVSLEHPTYPIIIANDINLTYDATSGSIDYTISNPTSATLTATSTADWISNIIVGSESVTFTTTANEGDEDRSATITLSYEGAADKVITVTQAHYVPDYATLPFAFNNGKDAIDETNGLTQSGLGSDYSDENTKLKFDSTDDYVILKINERPGTLTFNIKGNSFSGGTFKVQTSADGVSYSDLKTYTTFGTNDTFEETFDNLDENVRYIKWIYTNKVSGNVGLGKIALAKSVDPVIVPSVTITPDHFELDANAHMGESLTTIAYQNIVVVPGDGYESFDVQYYDAEGNEIGQTWCSVGAAAQGDTDFDLVIFAFANDEAEARTVYFKLYAHDADSNLVYSNLVTITQAAPVIDYATLPFEWEGGASAEFLALNGVTAQGLGSDYASGNAPYLIKFDNTGDYIQVKCDQQPGKVTIGVKMIGGGNTSTITVQGSADGETFTDIEELTISGAQGDVLTLETTNSFADTDRYVRMLFTKGSNVGVGPITIEKGLVPSIVVTPATINLEAFGTAPNGSQMTQVNIAYNNFEIESFSDFTIQFYDAEGEEQDQPDWISSTNISGGGEMAYFVVLFVSPNEGSARSTYFKVFAMDDEDNLVYSNLVTINQASAAVQYTLTVEPFENLEIFTFVDDELTEPMEGAGTIQVAEGVNVMLSVSAVEGYVMETLMVNGVNHVNDIADDFTYTFEMPAENVTISATAVEDVPPTSGTWVLTNLANLTEDDVFVIVATRLDANYAGNYAMSNDNGTSAAPAAVAVTVAEGTLSGEPAANLQWNLSITDGGYIFYPNGTTEIWLYCTNSNDGVRVGTDANNVFTMSENGYLHHTATGRYIGIYNAQDWRCYTSEGGNIANQTFAFYKKVGEPAPQTFSKDIVGYGNGEGNYYLIALPIDGGENGVSPTTIGGMVTDAFDLYYFDEEADADGNEWINYDPNTFNLMTGKGYLYASQDSTTLVFTGTPIEGTTYVVTLAKTEYAEWSGWNLVGNPFTEIAYLEGGFEFYTLNGDGTLLVPATNNTIDPMEGIFVITDENGKTLTFTKEEPAKRSSVVLNLNDNHGLIDRAIVRFSESRQLPKFQLNPNSTKLYIPMDNQDYAVVRSEEVGELPVNFKAENDGNYTISVSADNVEFAYLHLLDNVTNADVDLLETPSYSFNARMNDNANRFKLVYATGTLSVSENFAFFSNGSLVINNEGEATMQVIDLNGRVLSSESINGNANVNVNAAAGVYMLRLVNGDNVKVQKVVVK